MKTFDRTLLQTSLEVRVAFMRDFIGFSAGDAATLNGAATLVAPLIKGIVDNVYAHLFEYDYTKKVFLERNAGFVIATVLGIDEATLSLASKTAVVRAFGKIMWIQQDLFQRHYIKTDEQMAETAKSELERESNERKENVDVSSRVEHQV